MAEKPKTEAPAPKINAKQRAEIAHKLIQSSQKSLAEAKKSFNKDNAQRTADAGKLLHPTEILNGTHDAGDVWRRLMTTRGGEARPITVEDLKSFESLARQLGDKYVKGITAKGVIDASLGIDRERAKKEIHTAIPIAAKGGTIRFATNAGPKSEQARHYVMVRIVDFERMAVRPETPEKIAAAMTRGKIQLSCGCGRWRFWFSYMGTIGGYNSNPEHRESAYPRIRNPGLHGLACKHILRVMAVFSQTPSFKAYLARMVQSEQTKVSSLLKREKIADMHKLAEQIASESSGKHHIKTTAEKRAEREARPSYQRQQEKAAVAREAAKQAKVSKQVDKTKAAAVVNFQKLLSLGAISQDQYNNMVKTLG